MPLPDPRGSATARFVCREASNLGEKKADRRHQVVGRVELGVLEPSS